MVNGGSTAMPYINNSNYQNGNPLHGMMRLNGSDVQVFDGTAWLNVGASYAGIGLSGEAESAIDWASKKRLEEMDLMQRMEKHPGLKQAYEAFKIMDALTLEEEKNVSQQA